MKVTKSIAEEVAKKMIQPKIDEIKELQGKLSELSSNFMWSKVPECVVRVSDVFPEYIKQECSIRFDGLGINRKHIYLQGDVPKSGGYYYELKPDSKYDVQFSDKAVKLINEIEKKEDAKNLLEISIYNALIAFGTVKRCVEGFPECADFMPKDGKPMLPAVNLDKIRELL